MLLFKSTPLFPSTHPPHIFSIYFPLCQINREIQFSHTFLCFHLTRIFSGRAAEALFVHDLPHAILASQKASWGCREATWESERLDILFAVVSPWRLFASNLFVIYFASVRPRWSVKNPQLSPWQIALDCREIPSGNFPLGRFDFFFFFPCNSPARCLH